MQKDIKNIRYDFTKQQKRLRNAGQNAALTALGAGLMGYPVIFEHYNLSPATIITLTAGTVACSIGTLVSLYKMEKANCNLRELFRQGAKSHNK